MCTHESHPREETTLVLPDTYTCRVYASTQLYEYCAATGFGHEDGWIQRFQINPAGYQIDEFFNTLYMKSTDIIGEGPNGVFTNPEEAKMVLSISDEEKEMLQEIVTRLPTESFIYVNGRSECNETGRIYIFEDTPDGLQQAYRAYYRHVEDVMKEVNEERKTKRVECELNNKPCPYTNSPEPTGTDINVDWDPAIVRYFTGKMKSEGEILGHYEAEIEFDPVTWLLVLKNPEKRAMYV